MFERKPAGIFWESKLADLSSGVQRGQFVLFRAFETTIFQGKSRTKLSTVEGSGLGLLCLFQGGWKVRSRMLVGRDGVLGNISGT